MGRLHSSRLMIQRDHTKADPSGLNHQGIAMDCIIDSNHSTRLHETSTLRLCSKTTYPCILYTIIHRIKYSILQAPQPQKPPNKKGVFNPPPPLHLHRLNRIPRRTMALHRLSRRHQPRPLN
jgi:hypothetical protein